MRNIEVVAPRLGFWLRRRPTRFPGNVVASDNVKARLISEADAIAPGQSIWVALELNIRDGWHTYWRNPGDSGQATKLTWTLPAGVTAGDIVWTTPHRFDIAAAGQLRLRQARHASGANHGSPGPQGRGCRSSLAAKASWLVCSDVCIPESADLQLRLPVTARADGAIDPAAAPVVRGGPQRSSERGTRRRPARGFSDGQLVLTLGTEWGSTLLADQIAGVLSL